MPQNAPSLRERFRRSPDRHSAAGPGRSASLPKGGAQSSGAHAGARAPGGVPLKGGMIKRG
ncbi:MAG: hypothetical protein K6E40_10140 [Desulfovibrio sp.]|nr:hypothetical protein [Desulfovibrio sp.]